MACCSGCSAPSQTVSASTAAKPATVTETVTMAETTMSPKDEMLAGAGTDPAEHSVQTTQELDMPAPKPSPTQLAPEPDAAGCCKDSCCDVPPQPSRDKTAPPPCCEGKPSPCCDVSCLDRLALRACGDGKQDLKTNLGSETSCGGSAEGKACNYHARKTRDSYAATLEAIGCICRTLLALGEESCCLPKQRSSIDRQRGSKRSSRARKPSPTPSAADSCCSGGSCNKPAPRPTNKSSSCSKGCCGDPTPAKIEKPEPCSRGCCGEPAPKQPVKPDACSKDCCGEPALTKPEQPTSCSSGCCGNPVPTTMEKSTSCSKGCCGDSALAKTSEANACPQGCCGDAKATPTSDRATSCGPEKISSGCCSPDSDLGIDPAPIDLEKGLVGREHIVLSVSGMTCTGCETKLQRSLNPLASVKNLKTSLVLARAEFDLDTQNGSLDEVLKHLERTTEFKCERVATHGSSIDLITPGDPADLIKQQWPKGVMDMNPVDKKTVRVVYDPKLIGARDLVEHGWGTPLALAPPQPDPTLAAGNKHVRNIGYMTLLSIALTVPVLVMAWAPLPDREIACNSASLALATIVQVVIAGPFYPKALKALVFSRVIEMDLLIVLSTSAAYVFSVVSFGYLVAGKPLSTGSFFETSTLLVTLIMVGRFVAALARQKAVESISIHSLQPTTAILIADDGDREIDARLLQYGDAFRVVPESRVPTDGTVLFGSSEADESMITGESRPVEKHAGSALIAGTINGSGTLVARVTRLPGANTIDMIAGMVDEAKLSKPKLQHLADLVASYFVPAVVVLMLITLVIWIAVGVAVRHQSGAEATIQAITYAITVLIVSCPCAVGLAVPMVVVIATGVGAERGVIFKSAESIEVAYKTTHVVLDKTGTLTAGKLSVIAEQYLVSEHAISTSAPLLLSLVTNIAHPVSAAVAAHLSHLNLPATPVTVTDIKTLPGRGIEGTAPSGLPLRAGNAHWLGLSSHPAVAPLLARGHTVLCFTIASSLAAVFALRDVLREDTPAVVRALHGRGVQVHVLSGDDDGAVRAVTDALAIPEANVRARCSPADKAAYIRGLLAAPRGKGQPQPVVLFCGDGTNDAPALAQATVGIAMARDEASASSGGGGAAGEVAKSAADVVLMRPSLGGVVTAMDLSRRAVGRIWFNFAWSFVYNLFAVLLAAGAFVTVRIPPEYAGLGELVSVLPVVVAAVALRWERV